MGERRRDHVSPPDWLHSAVGDSLAREVESRTCAFVASKELLSGAQDDSEGGWRWGWGVRKVPSVFVIASSPPPLLPHPSAGSHVRLRLTLGEAMAEV